MKPFEQQNYYELLEIPVSSSADEIRAAYTRALEAYSPDSVALYALVDEDQLEALRKRLTEAVEYLTDPELRVEYDRSIGLSPSAANTAVPPMPSLVEKAPEAPAPAVQAEAPKPEPLPAVEPAPPAIAAEAPKQEPARAEPAPVVEAVAPKQEAPAAEPVPPAAEAVAPKQEPERAAAPVVQAVAETAAPAEKGSAEAAREAPAQEARSDKEAPRPPYQSFPIAYVPRSLVEPGQFNSVSFFTSFTIPVAAATPAPVAEAEPKKQEPTEAPAAEPRAPEPRAAEPAPSAEPRAAEPAPRAEPVAVSPAEPVPVASAPVHAAPPPEAAAPEPKPAEKPEAAALPVLDVADMVVDSADEVTPARIKAHKRSPAAERLAQARPVESSRPAGAPATPRAVPPPLPPKGARVARPASPGGPTPVASQPVEPARSAPPPARNEPAAARPEPTPARPPSSPPAESGLSPAPRPREQARPRLDIPSDAEFNGELLRRVRESRGQSLQQVAERTRITLRHLENVEADRYGDLPAPVYLRGILMNLARELGLDPLRVSRSYLTLVSKPKG